MRYKTFSLPQLSWLTPLHYSTAKHIRKDFWPGFNSAAGIFCMGEVYDGGVAFNAPYQNVLDSVLDYPTYYQLTWVALLLSDYGGNDQC